MLLEPAGPFEPAGNGGTIPSDPAVEAAKRLRAARLKRGRGLAEVADKAGIGPRQLAHMERMLSPKAQERYLPALCEVLDIPIRWVIRGKDLGGNVDPVPAVKTDEKTRSELGDRSQKRRQELHLSAAYCAFKLGVSDQVFKYREQALPRVIDPDYEGRWEKLLQVPLGWLRNPGAVTPEIIVTLDATSVAGVARQLATWATKTKTEYRSTDRRALKPAKDLAVKLFLSRFAARNRGILAIASEAGMGKTTAYATLRRMDERISRGRFQAPAIDAFKAIFPIPPRLVKNPPEAIRDMMGEGFTVETSLRFIRAYFN